MSGAAQIRLGGAVILLGLVALSGDLWWAWHHAPYDQGAGWVALAWVVVVAWAAGRDALPAMGGLLPPLGLGLISTVGELNVARHAAIVLAAVAWIPGWRKRCWVGLSGVAWWPALGWATAQLIDGSAVIWVRLVILIGGGLALFGRPNATVRSEVST